MKTRDLLMGAALAALLLAPATALAADPGGEIVTAISHAELAATATDPMYPHMHLQHTLNCLVGPGGKGFDPKALNPCANAGNGAIPDTTDPAKKKQLEAAAELTREGLAEKDFEKSKADAAKVAAALKAIK